MNGRPELLAPRLDAIPDELRAADQWVVWVPRWIDKPELPAGGKWSKIPHNAANGQAASSTDPQTWNGFGAAANAYEKGRDRFGGVGFVLHDADPYAGIDLDHAIRADGTLTPETARFVALLNSYTEVSPSGSGLRIFVRATLPPGGRKKGDVEMYESGRFLTVTGRRWPGTPATVEERQAEVEALHAEVWPAKPPDPEQKKRAQTAASTSREHLPPDDHDLLELAYKAKNGAAIQALYSGNTSGYPGPSEADLALCSLLAFYTGDDPTRLARLFRNSGLFRDKWDRNARAGETYGEGTIRLALAGCTEFYSPPGVRSEALENRLKSNSVKKNNFAGTLPVPENSPWEPPVPFGAFALPPFPVEALGGKVAPFVAALAEATQTPPDMAGVLVLPTLAACVQTKAEIEGAPGWVEPLMFFGAAVAESGTRKSAVVRAVSAPVLSHEAREIARRLPLREEAEDKRDLLARKLEHAKQQAVKGKTSDERLAGEADRETYRAELAALEVPGEFRLFTEDCSVERLPGLMQENGGRMAVLSAEGDVLAIMAGRYSDRGPNLLIFKKGHTGEPFQSDRIGRKGENIPAPALTLGVAFQPSVLRELFKVPALRGEGLLARFLYAVPPSRVGQRKIRPSPVPAQVAEDYARVIDALLALPYPPEGEPPPVIRLSPEADTLFYEHQEATEVNLRAGGKLASLADWGGKLCGEVLRVAALLHLSRGYGFVQSVAAGTMADAIEIGDYFIEHARAAFAEMGGDKTADDAKAVIAWLRTRGETPEGFRFRERDLWRNFADRFKEKDAMAACLAFLCDRHFVRPTEEEARTGAGRKPTPLFSVNPALFKDGEVPAKLNQLPKLPESDENGDEPEFEEGVIGDDDDAE